MQNPRFASHCFLGLILALASPALAEVSVPNVFSDHMVLQRQTDAPIWGKAEPGERVSVQLADKAPVSASADKDGKWQVRLPTGEAVGPFTLTITGKNTITITDVLIGEVWYCGGQSNMEWRVKDANNAAQEIADSVNRPLIRHIGPPHIAHNEPQDDQPARWEACSPETIGEWTAVGYFFARNLQDELNVPIGLLGVNWGGTRIEPWTPPEGFASVSLLEPIFKNVQQRNPQSEAYKTLMNDYVTRAEVWLTQLRESVATGKQAPEAPAYPAETLPFTDRQDPTALYNGMLHPVIPYAIRGAIWYQGESNRNDTDCPYADKTLALVQGWRKVWQPKIPYYYVQIAPYQYGSENPAQLPKFWVEQARIETILPDSGMVVVNDVGNPTNIHPTDKQTVGKRLANMALSRTYGIKGIVDHSPMFEKLTLAGDKLRVQFNQVGSGLASRDDQPLNWFQIIGQGTGWHDAEAVIEGKDTVVLFSPDVPAPVAVRFAWDKLAAPNLMNKEGLPAPAFIAGDVPQGDPLVVDVPESSEYQLVYDLDLHKLAASIKYDQDLSATAPADFDRIAYFLELQKPNEPLLWVYVSMDAFTGDISKIGIPTNDSGATFQQNVSNLNIYTNVPGVATGNGISTGNIEFWPNNYSVVNAAKVPNASETIYDLGDRIDPNKVAGHGCMQVHNYAAKQTIFAINDWRGADPELGIGNANIGRHTDWTFADNAKQFQVKRLRVFVHAAPPPPADPLTEAVPEVKDYQLIYDLNLNRAGEKITYDIDNSAAAPAKFSRVAYCLELQKPDQPQQWVYVSMDAFSDDVKKIGIPTFDSGANFQKNVNNLHIFSNVAGLNTGDVPAGNIEFWPNNYKQDASRGITGASGTLFDFDDTLNTSRVNGYGCMQVHNPFARQTLFAINNWKNAPSDIGIGNNSNGDNPDWTFQKNSNDYSYKRLRVFVLPAN
ncbi:MAG: 9-O-acetylesterase [Phycisphaeraceae bacterium]|nr:9-O-acetylesterase [Phycisphaeraceae bacterium]